MRHLYNAMPADPIPPPPEINEGPLRPEWRSEVDRRRERIEGEASKGLAHGEARNKTRKLLDYLHQCLAIPAHAPPHPVVRNPEAIALIEISMSETMASALSVCPLATKPRHSRRSAICW